MRLLPSCLAPEFLRAGCHAQAEGAGMFLDTGSAWPRFAWAWHPAPGLPLGHCLMQEVIERTPHRLGAPLEVRFSRCGDS